MRRTALLIPIVAVVLARQLGAEGVEGLCLLCSPPEERLGRAAAFALAGDVDRAGELFRSVPRPPAADLAEAARRWDATLLVAQIQHRLLGTLLGLEPGDPFDLMTELVARDHLADPLVGVWGHVAVAVARRAGDPALERALIYRACAWQRGEGKGEAALRRAVAQAPPAILANLEPTPAEHRAIRAGECDVPAGRVADTGAGSRPAHDPARGTRSGSRSRRADRPRRNAPPDRSRGGGYGRRRPR